MNTVSVNARIYSARIFVIAVDWSVDTSRVRITRISGARIVVVTRNCNVFASSCLVARIGGTCITVITALWSALALAVNTAFNGTNVLIITAENVLTFSINAFVNSTSVVIVTVNWSVYTSLSWNTRVSGARIFVITKSIVRSADASTVRIASIYSTCDTIVAILWCVDDSLL
jgi:hypothetical protein